MHASRSRTWARDADVPTLTLSMLALITAFALLLLRPATVAGATAAAADTAATADEGGFRVRVVEETSGSTASKARKVTTKSTGAPQASIPEPPTPPEPPEPPELPDLDIDFDSGENNVVRFGEDIEISADKVIDGDVVSIGGDVTVFGRVKGDVVSIGGAVHVEGSGVVEGDAVSMGGGGVTVSDSASIGGSNVSLGSWSIDHPGRFWPVAGIFGAMSIGIWLITTLIKLALTLLFAWLALLLAKERMVHATDVMSQRFGKSFLLGLAGWAVMVVTLPVAIVALVLVGAIAAAILCITIIGIPVAVLLVIAIVLGIIGLVLAVMLAGFVAFLNGTMFLGRRVLSKNPAAAQKPLLAILAGLILLTLLQVAGKLIGFVGVVLFHPIAIALGIAVGVLAIVLATAGLGGMISIRFRAGPGGAGGSQWWPPSRDAGPAGPGSGGAPSGGAPAGGAPSAGAPLAPPPEGGTSDAP